MPGYYTRFVYVTLTMHILRYMLGFILTLFVIAGIVMNLPHIIPRTMIVLLP